MSVSPTDIREHTLAAFATNDFRLLYMPIVDVVTGEPLFYESFARIFTPEGQDIPAADFIPLVEKMNLALELDQKVFDLAMQDLLEHPNLFLSINVSGQSASNVSYQRYIETPLQQDQHSAARLMIEITETAKIADIDQVNRLIRYVRNKGVQVALDDVGHGHMSIKNIKRFKNATALKIDKRLLKDFPNRPVLVEEISEIAGYAQAHDIIVIAEGVEDKAQAPFLADLGIDFIQSFAFGEATFEKPHMLARPWARPSFFEYSLRNG